jgi:phosphatidylserine decarboxylase
MIIDEGLRPILISAWAGVVFHILSMRTLGWLSVAVALLLLLLARNPPRSSRSQEPLVLAPADGRVTRITATTLPLEEPNLPVTIEISNGFFDVHVARAPIDGRPKSPAHHHSQSSSRRVHQPGSDERIQLIWESSNGPVAVRQAAVTFGKRLTDSTATGTAVRRGDRVGLTRPGDSVELLLPLQAEVLTTVGEHVRAGETTIARLPHGVER